MSAPEQDTTVPPSAEPPAAEPVPSKGNGMAVVEAAALLTIWSLLVINEGAIRFNRLVSFGPMGKAVVNYDDLSSTVAGRPSLGLRFFASLFEVVFGFIGLYVGVSAFVYRAYSTAITKIGMLLQSLMGWFVFVIYVFLIPAFKASDMGNDAEDALPLGLSLGTNRFLIAMGILTSLHWCLALQGGQFIFFARLISAATGHDFLKQATGLKMRAGFWSGNLALAGLWSFISGCVLVDKLGSGKTKMPFVYPPNVGRQPTLLLVVGLVMFLTGVACVAMALLDQNPPLAFYGVVGVSFLFAWLNFTIVQFGLIPADRSGPVAMHAGLVFMVYFLGPYFLYKNSRSKNTVPEPEYTV